MRRATIPVFGDRHTDVWLLLVAMVPALVSGCALRRITHVPPTREGAPYSRAVWVDDTLYLSGDGAPHEDPVEEAHQLMRSVKATLESEGLTLDDLVQVTVYCTDVSLYEKFNGVYRGYFKAELPARAFIGSGQLLWGMRYELQGIATRK